MEIPKKGTPKGEDGLLRGFPQKKGKGFSPGKREGGSFGIPCVEKTRDQRSSLSPKRE